MLKKDELTIYLTSRCNLKCKHCYRIDGNSELTPDDMYWIRDNIKNKRTTFLGGEPMMYPYLKDCIDLFPQVTLSTNSTLVNEDTVGTLKGVTGVQLSIEIGKTETNYIRGEHVWEDAMAASDLLKGEGIERFFRVSYWEGNLQFLKEFNGGDVPLVLFPRVDKPALPPQLTQQLFEQVITHGWILALPNFMQYIGKRGRCKAATERINVLFNRKLTPCNMDLDYHLGKIGDDLGLIEKNIYNFVENNKSLPPECNGCKNKEICGGSCYATHVSKGCPLRYDYNLHDFMHSQNITEKDMKKQTDKMFTFMKRMLVC